MLCMVPIHFLSTFSFVYIAGVAGGAASGKTAVCDMIIQQLHDQRVVLVNQVTNSFYIYFFGGQIENLYLFSVCGSERY